MTCLKVLFLVLGLCVATLPTIHAMGRIVGGSESSIERRPYMASLQYNTLGLISHTCGASIISTRYLLSAAHCNPGSVNIRLLWARVGSTAYNSGGQSLKVTTFVPHPDYFADILDYDFAVIGFADGDEIQLGPNVAVVPLIEKDNPEPGSLAVVSGWGVTSEASSVPPINLREADIPVVSDEVCKETYDWLTDRQICIGGTPQGMLSACFGDSGGPAVYEGVQFSLVSGGNSCELPNVPAIFAKISRVRDWITEQTGV